MLNVAIVAGGDSGEYEVSIGSGQQVFQHLDRTRFNPFLIGIKKDEWNCIHDGISIPVDKNDFSITMDGLKIRFDVVFNAIHGTPGENGLLTGYLDMLDIPYTSCDVTTSALTFNKAFCKKVVESYGVTTAKSVHLFKRMNDPASEILGTISFPCFVKPNNGGSSVGMSKVNHPDDLEAALDKAFREDDEVIVEEFMRGRELTCGVLRTRGELIAFPVTEVISKKEFFDYEAKYSEGLAMEVVPAAIDQKVAEECQAISKNLYEKLNCKGVVRFDYIYNNADFGFLEVNTVPGLSAQSIVPKMARAYGWNMTDLFTRLIETALNDTVPSLLFATNNMHKLREVREIFGSEFNILSLSDARFEGEIPEDQDTIAGNAIQKARYIFDQTGRNCFADDTGLFIEALDGRPGVYSARYAGEGCSFDDNVRKILHEMEGKSNRKAEFRCVFCLILEGKEHLFEGVVKGSILHKKTGEGGFGYDPVFLPEGQKQSFSEMPAYLKNGISHRGRAVVKMMRFLKNQ
ncbi:MAG: D-alanine--D-alanine ligase [Syntrophothermus sp.]